MKIAGFLLLLLVITPFTSGFASDLGLAAPGNVYASRDNEEHVEIRWYPAPLATVYQVYRNGEPLSGWTEELSYTDDQIAPGEWAEYHVISALDSSGTRASAPSRTTYGIRPQNPAGSTTLYTLGINYTSDLQVGVREGPWPHFIDSGIKDISSGRAHTLMVRKDGTLWGVGSNRDGQLGKSQEEMEQAYEWVPIDTDVVSVATGTDHSLYLKADGTLWGMGANQDFQLGGDRRLTHTRKIDDGVVFIAANETWTAYIKSDKTLWAVGRGYSRVGEYDAQNRQFHPKQWASDVKEVDLGRDHLLLVKTDGTLWGFGGNLNGQLGPISEYYNDEVTQFAEGVTAVAAGFGFSLYIMENGELWGMGSNESGQLSGEPTTDPVGPRLIASNVRNVQASAHSTLYVTGEGHLMSLGNNYEGQLGVDTGGELQTSVPQLVDVGVVEVLGGRTRSFYITEDDTLWGMGSNSNGTLGLGNNDRDTLPTPVFSGIEKVDSSRYHSLLLGEDKKLWSVGGLRGEYLYFPLWNNHTFSFPQFVASDVEDMATGVNHAVFITSDNTLWGFGSNLYGQLGDLPLDLYSEPVVIATDVVKAAATDDDTFYIKTDGTLWKLNGNPRQIAEDVVRLEAGGSHLIFSKTDGSLWGYGSNSRLELGREIKSFENGGWFEIPIEIAPFARSFSAASGQTLYVDEEGILWGMGEIYYQSNQGYLPIKLATNVVAVSSKRESTLFTTTDGWMWLLGGDVRDLSFPTAREPQRIDNGVSSMSVGSGYIHYVKEPFESHSVTFDLGKHGSVADESLLNQVVDHGSAAIVPVVASAPSTVFSHWSISPAYANFNQVNTRILATAIYDEFDPPVSVPAEQETILDWNGGGETVTMDGSGSYDPNGTIESWVWTWEANGPQTAEGEITAIDLPVGIAEVTLTVTDNHGISRSDTVPIEIVPAPALERPTGVEASTDRTDAVLITWDPVPDATHYRIFLRTGYVTEPFSEWIPTLSFLDETISPDSARYYSVRAAVNAEGFRSSRRSPEVKGARPLPTEIIQSVIGSFQKEISDDFTALRFTYQNLPLDDSPFVIEFSLDLKNWTDVDNSPFPTGILNSEIIEIDGKEFWLKTFPLTNEAFYRLRYIAP